MCVVIPRPVGDGGRTEVLRGAPDAQHALGGGVDDATDVPLPCIHACTLLLRLANICVKKVYGRHMKLHCRFMEVIRKVYRSYMEAIRQEYRSCSYGMYMPAKWQVNGSSSKGVWQRYGSYDVEIIQKGTWESCTVKMPWHENSQGGAPDN